VFIQVRREREPHRKEKIMSGIVYVLVAFIGLLFGAMSLTSWKK
jgi:hypothetical protein